MKNVAPESRKETGQLLNTLKKLAQDKYDDLKLLSAKKENGTLPPKNIITFLKPLPSVNWTG